MKKGPARHFEARLEFRENDFRNPQIFKDIDVIRAGCSRYSFEPSI